MLTDEDLEGKLRNFCYRECNNSSPQDIKNCRGLVYKDEKPFLKSFGYTPTYTINDIPKDIDFQNCRFFESFEGTLLRLFYNDINNRWYLSTHRKLDASKSFWGSEETFGDRFNRIIKKEDYDLLDKKYHYMFLMTPSESNRIVCTENLNKILHVGTYDRDFNLSFDYDIKVQKPNEFIFNNYEEFKKQVENMDITSFQGIIISNVRTQENIKVLNSKYNYYNEVRGNVASVNFRYLQVRQDSELRQELMNMYPKSIINFEKYEEYLSMCVNNIHKNYILRFVKHQYVTISPEEHIIMKSCHDWHKQNKKENIVTKKKIIEILNQQTPVHLNRIIKIYKNEQNEQNKQ